MCENDKVVLGDIPYEESRHPDPYAKKIEHLQDQIRVLKTTVEILRQEIEELKTR